MAEQGERGRVLAALMLQDPHVVEDVGMIRPALEQDLVDQFRVVELLELVALDRELQRLFRREVELTLPRFGVVGWVGGGVARPAAMSLPAAR
jgi:hypothetical protein